MRRRSCHSDGGVLQREHSQIDVICRLFCVATGCHRGDFAKRLGDIGDNRLQNARVVVELFRRLGYDAVKRGGSRRGGSFLQTC